MYITTTELENAGVSGTSSELERYIKSAQKVIDKYCNLYEKSNAAFEKHDKTEEKKYNQNWPYYLNHSVINSIETIWGEDASTIDTKLDYRELKIDTDEILQYDTTWETIKIKYNVWFTTIPSDIKTATIQIAKQIAQSEDQNVASGEVEQLRQNDLEITYRDTENITFLTKKAKEYLWEYKISNVYTEWADWLI